MLLLEATRHGESPRHSEYQQKSIALRVIVFILPSRRPLPDSRKNLVLAVAAVHLGCDIRAGVWGEPGEGVTNAKRQNEHKP